MSAFARFCSRAVVVVLLTAAVWGEDLLSETNALAPSSVAEAASTNDLGGTLAAPAVVPVEPAPPAGPDPATAAVAAVEASMSKLSPAVEALSSRLGAIEEGLLLQHQRSIEVTQQAMRTILVVSGCFATAVLLGVLMAAVILSRAVQHMTEVVVAAIPPNRQLAAAPAPLALEAGAGSSALPVPVEQVTAKFAAVLQQLERRIGELEHAGHLGGAGENGGSANGNGAGTEPGNGEGPRTLDFSVSALQAKQYPDGSDAGDNGRASASPLAVWLGRGQALLNLGQAEESLACFEKALELAPRHADAHVRKGMALEKLQRLDAALEAYDQAIAADGSFTLAYLYKGAVCNRLQRYREALECYESALKCEQKQAV